VNNTTNTGQPTAIYIYALIAGIIGFWQSESIGTGFVFAAVCAAAIWVAQEERYNLILSPVFSWLKILYFTLRNWRLPEQEATKTEPYVICPGQDIESRQYLMTDLQELGSFMVVGITGSGKTSFVHSILHQLLCNSNPIDLRFVISDLKEGLDFRIYKRLPHLLLPVATTTNETNEQINRLLSEMSERAQLFKAIPQDRLCNNLDDYHRLGSALGLPRLPRIVMIVDEFQNITNESEQALNGMVKLAKEGRAFGISLIPATQLGNVAAVPTALKSQMSSIFCAYLKNPSHYYKIMEIAKEYWEPFHAQGKIRGRFIADIAGEINIIQSLYVTKRELEETARQWSENRTEPTWSKKQMKTANQNPVLWQGSDDEKTAMIMNWFTGFDSMPTLAEFQEKFGASQGTYYNWIPRLWDEK
jgi:hypothetical protein